MKRDISRPTYIVCSQEFYIGHSLTIVSKLFYVRSISIQDATWLLCHTYEPLRSVEISTAFYGISVKLDAICRYRYSEQYIM